MTTQQIADALGLTAQQARNIARMKGWSPIRVGGPGRGAGTLYRRRDVEKEARDRIEQARQEIRRLQHWLNESRKSGGKG